MKRILTHYTPQPFQGLKTNDDLSRILKIPLGTLLYHAYGKGSRYKTEQIPKPDGSMRTLHKPNPTLKQMQRKILRQLSIGAPLGKSIYGVGTGRGIADNARLHSRNPYVARFDIRSYFPSIHRTMIESLFCDLGCEKDTAHLLTALTTNNHCLPQGAPTSNYLSALVFANADHRLELLARKNRLIYSRYFDDITLSGKNAIQPFSQDVRSIVREGGFVLNTRKTRYFEPSEDKNITGVVVRSGTLCVPIQQDYVESYLTKLENGIITEAQCWADKKHIEGYLSFINQINSTASAALKGRYEQLLRPQR